MREMALRAWPLRQEELIRLDDHPHVQPPGETKHASNQAKLPGMPQAPSQTRRDHRRAVHPRGPRGPAAWRHADRPRANDRACAQACGRVAGRPGGRPRWWWKGMRAGGRRGAAGGTGGRAAESNGRAGRWLGLFPPHHHVTRTSLLVASRVASSAASRGPRCPCDVPSCPQKPPRRAPGAGLAGGGPCLPALGPRLPDLPSMLRAKPRIWELGPKSNMRPTTAGAVPATVCTSARWWPGRGALALRDGVLDRARRSFLNVARRAATGAQGVHLVVDER
jgi:hypothetical protein